MFGKAEIFTILAVSLVIAFSISLLDSWNAFLYALLAVFVVIMINVLAKKIAGYYLESDVEISLWHVNRSGFKPNQKFKKPLADFKNNRNRRCVFAFYPKIFKFLKRPYLAYSF